MNNKKLYFCGHIFSGCSAVRLARYVRDVEVVSSNLTTPTIEKVLLFHSRAFLFGFWANLFEDQKRIKKTV